jgi:FdhD protein
VREVVKVKTSSSKTSRTVWAYDGAQFKPVADDIALEFPLTIYVNEREFATTVCTPTDMEELVTGFLATEGVIDRYEDIRQLLIDDHHGLAFVDLHRELPLDPAQFVKRRITSCCGKSRQSIYFMSDARTAKEIDSDLCITPEACFDYMQRLQAGSLVHQETGGVHNAALFIGDMLQCLHTDIGRHNALDKIHGACLMQGIDTKAAVLAFSGRLSSEVVIKAAKIGASILLSKSAPTDLALQLAEELGLTAAGFIRGSRMNLYTHPQRIAGNRLSPH